ncbi:Uncharacterized protein APZ42_027148 [Daphnia magna]|uniref:Uncharacterized protein n=1 Tax=Daphnia magna TaxID=35525 RepID=A0A164RBC6_9CRUS|nr:Uncharacterized protein APZ42_027148 [Daphnia magna]
MYSSRALVTIGKRVANPTVCESFVFPFFFFILRLDVGRACANVSQTNVDQEERESWHFSILDVGGRCFVKKRAVVSDSSRLCAILPCPASIDVVPSSADILLPKSFQSIQKVLDVIRLCSIEKLRLSRHSFAHRPVLLSC